MGKLIEPRRVLKNGLNRSFPASESLRAALGSRNTRAPLDSAPMSTWARSLVRSTFPLAVFLSVQALPLCGAAAESEPVATAAATPTASTEVTTPTVATQKDPAKPAKKATDDFTHGFRFGLRMGVVGGLRMVFRYSGDSAFCKQPEKDPGEAQKFCGHQAPYGLESALSFAVTDSIEPFLWGRFGLSGELETNTKPVRMLGIGTRIYSMQDSRLKIFFEPAVAWETEGGGNQPGYEKFDYPKELALHLGGGLQVELHEYVGVFLDAGMTTGVIRSLNSNLEVQVGLQGRTPAL